MLCSVEVRSMELISMELHSAELYSNSNLNSCNTISSRKNMVKKGFMKSLSLAGYHVSFPRWLYLQLLLFCIPKTEEKHQIYNLL